MASSSFERIITLTASIITLWSVWSAAPIGEVGSVLIFDGFSFGPRLVAVFVTDAFVIWVLSKVLFMCIKIHQSHAAIVLSLAVLAINSWQSAYLFHIVLFQKFELSTLELASFVALTLCSATMFGFLLHSHYSNYTKKFQSPFHVPGGHTRRFDIFALGKTGVVIMIIVSYIPFAVWAITDSATFYA